MADTLFDKFETQINKMLARHDGKRLVNVNGTMVGDGENTYVVAEAACNHMCDVETAIKMTDHAVKAGASAIKFQTYKAEKLVRANATLYWNGKETSQLEYYSRLDRLGADEYRTIFADANAKGILPFSTPFDTDNADMLNDLGMPLFKIASCDLPDHRLLKHVAEKGKPIVLSTGGSTTEEIDAAIEVLYDAGNFDIILLACTLSYPTPNPAANLRRVSALKERYPWMVIGLSDHTEPDDHMVIPALAVALGAHLIEKHYTLDRTMTGSGHFFSVNPQNLTDMIENIRIAEVVLGDARIEVIEAEQAARDSARRSIVAEQAIAKGERIESVMLGMKRPADGLPGSMMSSVVGKFAIADIEPDQAISVEMLSAEPVND